MTVHPVLARALRGALLTTLAFAPPASALDLNGFLPPAGQGDVALAFTSESYDEFWRGRTKVSNSAVGEVDTRSVSLWMRYGVTDRLALVANLPYVDAEGDGTAGFEDSGVQDLTVLALFRIVERESGSLRHRLVAAGGLRTPASDYEGDQPVSLGDDTTDALLRLVYQLESGSFYFSQQVGFDLRGEDAPDGFPLYTEVGYTFGRTTLSGYYQLYLADGGTDIGDPGFTFPSNQDETERVGAKVYVRAAEALGVFVGGFTTLDGRNSGDATGGFVGGTFRF